MNQVIEMGKECTRKGQRVRQRIQSQERKYKRKGRFINLVLTGNYGHHFQTWELRILSQSP